MFDHDEAALSEYAAACKTAKEQLRMVWADLELGEDAIRAELDRIVSRAHEVWSDAVTGAKERQREFGLLTEAALRESRSIQEELGQNRRQSAVGAGGEEGNMMMSSHARLERATREVEYWRSRKAERIKLMDKVQAEMNRLQGLLGQQPNSSLAGVIDINDATLEMMREEVERLKGAQVERTDRLAEKIRELQELCAVMSEDHSVLLRDVSPAVAAFRHEALAEEVSRIQSGKAEMDLSDDTFASLQKKHAEMEAIKAEREGKIEEAEHQLRELWSEMQVMESDVDRDIITQLLCSGDRLQPTTMEKCHAELERLEVIKARKTCHTIRMKNEELLKLAAEAHMEEPGLSSLVAAVAEGPCQGEPMVYVRKVAETLARVNQKLECVRADAQKRSCILDKIDEIGGSIDEVAWLKDYEQDSNRFKGRDSTRNLQRSIKAEKVRAHLPALLDSTIQALVDWEDREGEEFMYDEMCYKDHLLQLKKETEQALAAKGGPRGTGGSTRISTASSTPVAPGRRLQTGRPSTTAAGRTANRGATKTSEAVPASLQRSTGRGGANSTSTSPWSTPKKAAPPRGTPAATPPQQSANSATKSRSRMGAAVDVTPAPHAEQQAPPSPLIVSTSVIKELGELNGNSPRAPTPQSGSKSQKPKWEEGSNDVENCEPAQHPVPSPQQAARKALQTAANKPSRLPGPKSMLRPPSSRRMQT